MASPTIESVLNESRLFSPPASFTDTAAINSLDAYKALAEKAAADPAKFWAELAEQELHWFKPWETTLDWQPPFAKWFVGGKINISYNCLDRHLTTWRRNKAALIWEGEPGDSRTLTYAQLHREVCQVASVLKDLGVKKGDRVGIYMPMIPEAAIAMLACARIGAPHTVVFGGFSAEALKDRLNDAEAKLVITADGGFRKDKTVALKAAVDEALADNGVPSVENVLVVQRTKAEVTMHEGRDHWWHELQATADAHCPAEEMDAEDMLFILYTSGTTGKPKGVVHTTGGYNLYTHTTFKWTFDIKDTDVYWCTADVGWITGHSYIVYGPLSNGATTVMYEGVPRPSNPGCFWDVIEKYGVTIFYTAPTAIRAFIKMGDELPKARDLSSLRLLGTVGEPINPEAWMWYYNNVGGGKCPIVDTFWQTETGGHMITPMPGATPLVPGSCTLPFPGIQAAIVDEAGHDVPNGNGGILVVKKPWPSMIRTIWGDPDRFVKSYYPEELGGRLYLAGDGAIRDKDTGYFTIMGRIDDVLNVSGHRMGTMEIESALVANSLVAEAAVVGRPDDTTGEAIVAFVVLKGARPSGDDAKKVATDLRNWVGKEIGPIAKPKEIRFGDNLPKTRSGKIMRRLLRTLAKGEEITQDTSTLENPAILDQLKQSA